LFRKSDDGVGRVFQLQEQANDRQTVAIRQAGASSTVPFSFIIYGVLSAIAFAGFAFFGTNILVALGVGV
jgi:ABC-type sulfate transport system permease subunit